jgi:hypothetical protein
MLAAIRQDFFHYTPLRTKYLDSSRPIATVQRLTRKNLENLPPTGILFDGWGSWVSRAACR